MSSDCFHRMNRTMCSAARLPVVAISNFDLLGDQRTRIPVLGTCHRQPGLRVYNESERRAHLLSSPAVHCFEELSNQTAVHRCLMTPQQIALCERLKRLGYEKDKKLRMYGEDFDLISDPITIGEHLYVVDAIERKSKSFRRVRIPLPIINMVRHDLR